LASVPARLAGSVISSAAASASRAKRRATGVIDTLAHAAAEATAGRLWPATLLLLWASAGLSAIVDNIPYVATMSPIVADLVNATGGPDKAQVLSWALAIGADLGGNATAVARRRTSWCWASPNAPGTGSRSGISPSTA
jgi:hypothetical protein